MTPSGQSRICQGCKRPYLLETPDSWVEKHPDLKGRCPACVMDLIAEGD